VRQLQTHGVDVDEARAGQRVALNLSGVARDDVVRGNVLAAPRSIAPARVIDARIRLLRGAPPLPYRGRVRVYIAADEVIGRVRLLDRMRLDPGESAAVQLVLERPAVTVTREGLEGAWRCRMIKLGGMTPDMVYSWFGCRIGERNGHLWFEKSGTQRLSGDLFRYEQGGYVLLGAYSTKTEPPHRYSGNEPSAGAQATPDDAVGLLQATGRYSARIELPYPVQESVFDVIEMRR
jgi:hypothetical protein